MTRPRFSLLSLVLFSLLCASGMMLYFNYRVWRPILKSEPGVMRHKFDSEGKHLLTLTYDFDATLRTVEGETLWHKPKSHAQFNGELVEVQGVNGGESSYWHLNRKKWVSDGVLLEAEREEERLLSPISGSGLDGYLDFDEIPNRPDLLLGKTNQVKGDQYVDDIHILKKFRPEPWWGLAWLPEFWTTLVLAILFLWNLFRHSK
jgi:hypothetical protein